MINFDDNLSYNHLKKILQDELKKVSINQLYEISYQFNDEMKYLPREYKKNYKQTILNVVYSRFIRLKNDENNYEGYLTDDEKKNVQNLINKDKDNNTYILNITAIYATIFLKEPIHLPGTIFPGQKGIYTDGQDYYCPIKKYHLNNQDALCKYCIAITYNGDKNEKR